MSNEKTNAKTSLPPELRRYIGEKEWEMCRSPHAGSSTCTGCRGTQKEIDEHNEKVRAVKEYFKKQSPKGTK